MNEEVEWLRKFADEEAQEVFAEWGRTIDLVCAAARRSLGLVR